MKNTTLNHLLKLFVTKIYNQLKICSTIEKRSYKDNINNTFKIHSNKIIEEPIQTFQNMGNKSLHLKGIQKYNFHWIFKIII